MRLESLANKNHTTGMMADIRNLRNSLPGIDCGACGAPSCRAFAEDIIRGRADISSCVIKGVKDNDSK